jgi:hypothetical protein
MTPLFAASCGEFNPQRLNKTKGSEYLILFFIPPPIDLALPVTAMLQSRHPSLYPAHHVGISPFNT